MIRTFTFVTVILLCSAVVQAKATVTFVASSIEDINSKLGSNFPNDTLADPSEDKLLAFQGSMYEGRLDSLERTVPLNYNEFVQHYIDIYVQRKEQIGKMLGLSKYYFPIFEKALMEAGLPDELKFITVIESALNPHAVSRSGAVGPWQFMYTTAKGYGLVMDNYVDERKDPVKSSYAATHYFLDAYKRIGDWLLTIAAFNCGTGAVTRAIERSGGIADFWKVRAFLPKETQNYVPAFIATVYAMNHYRDHDIKVRPADFGVVTNVIPVDKRVSIGNVAKAANLDIKELLILNPSYKRQIINGSPGNPRALVIPDVDNRMYASLYEVLNSEAGRSQLILASVKKPETENDPAPQYHKVKAGQNLSSIAQMYDMTVQDLKVWNNLKVSTIVPGQNIRLSPPAKSSSESTVRGYMNYIVKAGDTLSGIAEKFNGMTVSKLKALNGLNGSAIVPGMRLIINQL
ncbi:lytic transglycosylase domain-containing protein [Daejeonella sp. JGW-45]|uniref:lytic transglycosylase domain-containing protein n=1 Tax=Daejeonella sp. JGW-45 TaxID=3034148 RepID=UPI0023ECD006|nr:lytic transglycosylase domain-containing protein [Daejeonella sp. JGW-45]